VTVEIGRWTPKQDLTEQEERMVERMDRTGKLFAFLRLHRHELMDEVFQAELATMYRQMGAGIAAVAPGLMAMATLLQGYMGVSGRDHGGVDCLRLDSADGVGLGAQGGDVRGEAAGVLCARSACCRG
jgi:hypothetical protein